MHYVSVRKRLYTAQNQSEEGDVNPTFNLYMNSPGSQLHEPYIYIIAHTCMKFYGLISVFHQNALNQIYGEMKKIHRYSNTPTKA